jgi:GTP1/Obg family GTP-binding protein
MRFTRSTRVLYAALAGLLALGLAPHVHAQQQDFSEKQLKSFAAAAEKLDKINTEYGNRIQNANSQEEELELREEAQSEMVNAVQDEGLSVETYIAIAQAAHENPKLLQRILQMHRP